MNPPLEKVEDIEISNTTTFNSLIKSFENAGGFTNKEFHKGLSILKEMQNDDTCTKFLSFPASIVATGTRGILKEMIKRKFVDVIITTCGTLDHDISRSISNYYNGDFSMDDKKLEQEGFHRLGSVLIPNSSYGETIENFMNPLLDEFYSLGNRSLSSNVLCELIGKKLNTEDSLLFWAQKQSIPVIVPGLVDGSVGSQLWLFNQKHSDFSLDIFEDQTLLSDIVFKSTKTGALIVGGGISKHHTIWWNQFKNGLDYAVYLTTANEFDGSLSGARTQEAISWGKIASNAKIANIYGEATLLLPFLILGLNK